MKRLIIAAFALLLTLSLGGKSSEQHDLFLSGGWQHLWGEHDLVLPMAHGGTLIAVDIKLDVKDHLWFGYENEFGGWAPFRVNYQSSVEVDGVTHYFAAYEREQQLGPYDGITDYQGSSGMTTISPDSSESIRIHISDPVILDAIEAGNGTYPLYFTNSASLWCWGHHSLTWRAEKNYTGEAIYHYGSRK